MVFQDRFPIKIYKRIIHPAINRTGEGVDRTCHPRVTGHNQQYLLKIQILIPLFNMRIRIRNLDILLNPLSDKKHAIVPSKCYCILHLKDKPDRRNQENFKDFDKAWLVLCNAIICHFEVSVMVMFSKILIPPLPL